MGILTRRSFLRESGLSIGSMTLAEALPAFLNRGNIKSDFFHKGRKLNVALCGLGNYAGMLADGLVASEYCNLAGIVTGHPLKAVEWQKKFNIPAANIYNYQNFDQISTNKDIDLVYIVLPNGLHKEFVIRAAKAGKHVITEKPMATSVRNCEEMIRACKDANVQLAVGYRLHYEPYHLEMKRLGQEKVFGQVRMIEASLGYKTCDPLKKDPDFNINDPKEWRLQKNLSGGGPLMDLGIYCIQSSRYVLGEEPVSVSAQYGPINDRERFSQVEESITWQMKFPSGAMSTCASSYGINTDRFFASADEGYFELSPGLSYGPFAGKTSKGVLNFPVINQQAAQLDAIARLILENEPLPGHITGEEGMKDIKIIEAVYRAANDSKMVSIG